MWYLFFFILVTACTEGKFMNFDRYHDVVIGEHISQIELSVGKPYEVHETSSNQKEYVFIERIPLADGRELFRKYILVVEHDKVVKKCIKEEVASAIMLHS